MTYQRVFAVGERADVASIVSELTKASAGDLGGLEISLVDAAGKPVRAPAGAKVVLATPAGAEVMSIVAAKDDATFGGEVPPGKWLVSFAPSVGRRSAAGAKVAVEVKKGAVAKATLAVTDVAQARCRLHREGRRGRRDRGDVAVQDHHRGARGHADARPRPRPRRPGPPKNQLIANVGEVAIAPGQVPAHVHARSGVRRRDVRVTLAAGALGP